MNRRLLTNTEGSFVSACVAPFSKNTTRLLNCGINPIIAGKLDTLKWS